MTGADGGAAVRQSRQWDVALSFAGAQREYVGQVAAALKARGVRCFYDADEQVRLWGTHLAEELPQIYAQESAAVVVFVSADYATGDWTRLERRAAFSRAVSEAGVYVLPARFDDSVMPGLLPDVGDVDLRGFTPGQFADLVVAKLADLARRPPLTSGVASAQEGAAVDADVVIEDIAERPDDRSYRSMGKKYLEWTANEWRYIDLGDLGAEPDFADPNRVRMLRLQKMYISLQADPRSVADRQRQDTVRRMDEDDLDVDIARRMSRQELLDSILARGPAGTDEGSIAGGSQNEAGISLEEAFARHRILVVLGGPGSGKSVLCLWLGCEVASETRRALAPGGTGRVRIPMLFRVAEYAKFYERELANGDSPAASPGSSRIPCMRRSVIPPGCCTGCSSVLWPTGRPCSLSMAWMSWPITGTR